MNMLGCHIFLSYQPPPPGTENLWHDETLGRAISQQQVYRADRAGMSYLFYYTKEHPPLPKLHPGTQNL